ncbi:MAG: hypothetical protein RL301_370 [Actinomycetota bacterium]
MASLTTKLSDVIGDRSAKVFEATLGIKSVGDLLRHYPRRYLVRGELTEIDSLREGDEVTILAQVHSAKSRRLFGRKGNILEVVVTDGNSKLALTFFNQAWREKELHPGVQALFAGKVGIFKNAKQLAHPDYQLIPTGSDVEQAISDYAGKYLPVYPATAKLPSWKITKAMNLVISSLDEIEDFLPEEIKKSEKFPTLHQALVQVHNPIDLESAEVARKRLTFDEAFLLQMTLLRRKTELAKISTSSRLAKPDGILAAFDNALPFKLTGGQIQVCKEITDDLAKSHPMQRLLQGEVGSGKTIVALRAMLTVIDAGGQAALLAPTEVLAQQHYSTINNLLGDLASANTLGASELATKVVLLTGSQSANERRNALAEIASGSAGIAIGTHALLGKDVDFKDLGLIVVDEQHRFGVEQRDALRGKAVTPPHLLVMTATPIPRTVAMTVFGDLDISTLRELPLGRQPITTHLVNAVTQPAFVTRAWDRIKEEVEQGHQAYVVAPRIAAGTSEDADLDFLFGLETKDQISVTELAPELATGPLKGLRVAELHGRLSSEIKEATMKAFSSGEIDVLVATTVIEVGVDVPNATVMVIMDADRFGISQLHQLRGRIGRGEAPGLCLLVTKAPADSLAMERLAAVAKTLDGFELARIDLDQRREGDVLGVAQSGTRSQLRLLRVLRDEDLILKAREAATKLIDSKQISSILESELALLSAEQELEYLEKA